jgi:beta-phosphoglucomutase-like phosphatase (HAD superfamily)
MTIPTHPPRDEERHATTRWYTPGYRDEPVRHTEAWEHETFAEEQARWERGDPEYARICEAVRRATEKSEQASLSADTTKAEWDARVATQRQANDDAEKASHGLTAVEAVASQTASPRSSQMHTRCTTASHDSPGAAIIPESVRRGEERGAATGSPRDETVLFVRPTEPR